MGHLQRGTRTRGPIDYVLTTMYLAGFWHWFQASLFVVRLWGETNVSMPGVHNVFPIIKGMPGVHKCLLTFPFDPTTFPIVWRLHQYPMKGVHKVSLRSTKGVDCLVSISFNSRFWSRRIVVERSESHKIHVVNLLNSSHEFCCSLKS